eukprot:g2998.t1
MSRCARAHLFPGVGPVKFHKIRKQKHVLSPILYGWYHNSPWAKFNSMAWRFGSASFTFESGAAEWPNLRGVAVLGVTVPGKMTCFKPTVDGRIPIK